MRLILAATLSLLAASAAQAAAPSPADHAALERLALDSDRDWDAKALDRFLGHHVADSSVRIAGDAAVLGREAMRGYFGRAFAARPAGFRHVSTLEHVDMIGRDTAIVDTQVRVEQRQADGSWALQRTFRTYVVAVRANGEWKLRAVRAAPLPAA